MDIASPSFTASIALCHVGSVSHERLSARCGRPYKPRRETPRIPHTHTTRRTIMDTRPGSELSIPQLLYALEGKLDQLMTPATRYVLFLLTERRALNSSFVQFVCSFKAFRLREDEVQYPPSSPKSRYLTLLTCRST